MTSANPCNTCSHLEVGSEVHEQPFYDMMHRQLELQKRLNRLPSPDCSFVERAYNAIYWRHCMHSECDELREWFDAPSAETLLEMEMEVVDILHFAFNIGIAIGITPQQLEEKLSTFTWVPVPEQYVSEHSVGNAILGLSMQLTKLIDCLPWKSWKNYDKYQANHDLLLDRYAAVVMWNCHLAAAAGMDRDRLYNVYCSKNKENHARQDRGY